MTNYQKLKQELETKGTGRFVVISNATLPFFGNGSIVTYKRMNEYRPGDIVFCLVKQRFLEAHKVQGANKELGYLIKNERGGILGWTKDVFGIIFMVEINGKIIYRFPGNRR